MTVDVAPGTLTPAQIAAYLGLDLRRVETQVVVAVAARYGLDPLLKHVIGIKSGGEIRPYITRDGLLHVAHASGQLDGIELIDGPTKRDDGHWHAVVRVHRRDWAHPVTYPGRYPARGGNEKYAPEMAVKVAECMALRRAFDVGGMAIAEEGPAWQANVDVVTGEIVAAQEHKNLAADTVDTAGRKATRTRKKTPPEEDPWQVMPNPDTNPETADVTKLQLATIHTIMRETLGIESQEQRRTLTEAIIGRLIDSSKELSKHEAIALIDTLKDIAGQDDPKAAVAALTSVDELRADDT